MTIRAGGCHCGAVRYEMSGEPSYKAICHCNDCRKAAGAPMVGWAMVGKGQLAITGQVKIYKSSPLGCRHFCPECGTGLFYTNAVVFPDMVDVQIATLDDAEEMVPEVQLQVAERLQWTKSLPVMPEFDRYFSG